MWVYCAFFLISAMNKRKFEGAYKYKCNFKKNWITEEPFFVVLRENQKEKVKEVSTMDFIILLSVTRLHSSAIFFSAILSRFENRCTFRLRKNKSSQGRQRIWLFNQSNHSIDLNQLISVERGISSSSFCDEGNIYSTSSELESKDRSN